MVVKNEDLRKTTFNVSISIGVAREIEEIAKRVSVNRSHLAEQIFLLGLESYKAKQA